jgi:arginine/ornithine transport system substrate-binding protein
LTVRLVPPIALVFLLLGYCFAALAQAPPLELRIGIEPGNPPYSLVDEEGTFRGSEAEIADSLCAELRARCKFIPFPFAQLITALQEQSIDAIISNMSVTEERERLVDFTDVYRNAANRFVARRNAGLDLSPQGLAGKKIGVRGSTINDRYVTEKYGAVAIIRRYSDLAELFVDLTLGRNDAIMLDVPRARASFLQTPLGADYEFVGPEISDKQWFGTGIGIAVRKGDNLRREALNRALAAIRADGTYERILSRYFQ